MNQNKLIQAGLQELIRKNYLRYLKQGLAKQSIHTMSRLHTVDPSTITETKDFRIQARMENQLPHTIMRLSDNEVFSIGDLVSNDTTMKGYITGFHATVSEQNGEIIMWVDHTWSKVGMALQDIHKLQQLPSRHQFGDPVMCYFVPDAELVKLSKMVSVPKTYSCTVEKLFTGTPDQKMVPVQATRVGIPGRVHAIHFLPSKVKYDIDMSFTGGANTRMYNIDSVYVFPAEKY